jgi:3-hydroxyisobutyrate dehydrogenase
MNIGVAGLGRMGSAIAARLMNVGHKVTVWNRTPEKIKPLAVAGAAIAADPAELAAGVETIITVLMDSASLAAVYEGPRGLLTSAVTDKLFIDISTVEPETVIAIAKNVHARGGMFIDCPVGGTVGPAREGKLLGMAGGPEADFARAKPVLADLCWRFEHVGPVGAGASLKLAINLPLHVYFQALGESYVLCKHLGLDPKWLVEFLTETSGAANILKRRGNNIAAALAGSDAGPPAWDIDLTRKDLALMVSEGKKLGTSLPLTEKTLAICDEAAGNGWGGRDASCMAAYWPSRIQRRKASQRGKCNS